MKYNLQSVDCSTKSTFLNPDLCFFHKACLIISQTISVERDGVDWVIIQVYLYFHKSYTYLFT